MASSQPREPAGNRKRVNGQPEPDRRLLIEKRLLESERLAVDLHVLDRAADLVVDSRIDAVVIVEAHPDAVHGPGVLVVGNLDSNDPRHDGRDRSGGHGARVVARGGHAGGSGDGTPGKRRFWRRKSGPWSPSMGKAWLDAPSPPPKPGPVVPIADSKASAPAALRRR